MKRLNLTLTSLYKNQKGFTLFEVMIAITILAFIMVSVISVTETSQTTADRVIGEDRELLQIETAMSRFEWDFSQIYSPLYFSHKTDPSGFTEEQIPAYEQLIQHYQGNERFSGISYEGIPIPIINSDEKNEVIFLTMSNRRKMQNIKNSHFAWVKYSLKSPEENTEEEGQNLIREFVTKDIFSKEEIDWDDVKDQILLRKVNKLEIEFWDKKSKKWNSNLRAVADGKSLLRGVKLKITYLNPDNNEVYSERIFRPLFPSFEPENMYKFLNEKPDPAKDQSGDDI